MAPTTTVSQRKLIKRKAPRGFLKRVFKRRKPHLRLTTDSDLLVHLNCLLFVHRLAEESRANACENKCGVIKKDHVLAAAKTYLLLFVGATPTLYPGEQKGVIISRAHSI
ncbi:centromere protein W isoform X1 [Sus scrofa]|uniref:Centromere protein W n=1 Tax=Sus scrofa TaxID=9823 RepID=A0A8D0SVP8_PIG|nr:centromere protein W isoform X1 [Sus scrofa]XP_013848033.1 centromere protein W isoform X1 [Sus scrofa]XP_020944231.1 centromere protein W isoform X1 [Sus scrofa]